MTMPAAINVYTILIAGFQLMTVGSLRVDPIRRKFLEKNWRLDNSQEPLTQ